MGTSAGQDKPIKDVRTQPGPDLLQSQYVKSIVSYASELLQPPALASLEYLYNGLAKDSLPPFWADPC